MYISLAKDEKYTSCGAGDKVRILTEQLIAESISDDQHEECFFFIC